MGGFDSLFGVAKFLMSSTNEKINTLNKGISECGQVYAHNLMQNAFQINTIISGTSQYIRNILIKNQVKLALDSGIPAVMLHSYNLQLANEIFQLVGGRNATMVDSNSANFSPFLGLQDYEAIDIIMESIPEKYDVKQNARYYLEAISDLMQANRIAASFNNYLTCPHDTVLDRIDNLVLSGKITDSDAQAMRSKIMAGQSEYYKIDSFLRSLNKQMGNASRHKNSTSQPVSIYKSVESNGFIAIDVGPSFNSIYVDFLIELLKMAIQKGKPFLLVLDSIELRENKKVKDVIIGGNGHSTTVVSCDDLLSSCGGNSELFASVVASAKQYMVFSHPSAISASQWASVIGEYERIDESHSKSTSRTDDGMGFWSMNVDNYTQKSRTVSTSKRRDFIIPPEKIVTMQNNEFFMKSETFKGIKHGYVTN